MKNTIHLYLCAAALIAGQDSAFSAEYKYTFIDSVISPAWGDISQSETKELTSPYATMTIRDFADRVEIELDRLGSQPGRISQVSFDYIPELNGLTRQDRLKYSNPDDPTPPYYYSSQNFISGNGTSWRIDNWTPISTNFDFSYSKVLSAGESVVITLENLPEGIQAESFLPMALRIRDAYGWGYGTERNAAVLASPIPEPSQAILLILGLASIVLTKSQRAQPGWSAA